MFILMTRDHASGLYMLKLSFKKMHLFATEIVTLGLVHRADGAILIKGEHAQKSLSTCGLLA